MIAKMHLLLLELILLLLLATVVLTVSANGYAFQPGRTFYVDSDRGNDSNSGLSFDSPLKTLGSLRNIRLLPGDSVLLKKGCLFNENIDLEVNGSIDHPVVIASYGSAGPKPVIQAAGYLAAVRIRNSQHLVIRDIELTSDGRTNEERSEEERFGVLMTADRPGNYRNIRLENLTIHHIFAAKEVPANGQRPASNKGMGIAVLVRNPEATLEDIRIDSCNISFTGHTGIRVSGFGDASHENFIQQVLITNNKLTHIGGPGIVPGRCKQVVVRGNVVDHPGSSADLRMHGRGSGIWPWTCHDVLIEKNKFMHARGKADSCGAHIDFNCSDVIVQYNLSMDNEGGFVEILGNDRNCAYRYNISINDGFRVKGENGAHQEGKVLWTSGYTGRGRKKTGPFNSYIYNNTIYVKPGSRSCFSFSATTQGILIANNIFYLKGKTLNVSGDQDTRGEGNGRSIDRAVFVNNLFLDENTLPSSLPVQDANSLLGDPAFGNPGGTSREDYIPHNKKLIRNRGIIVRNLPGDERGLAGGLEVKEDFMGNRIEGLPDIGAIEWTRADRK